MLTHYIKIAFRNMWKYKTQSFTSLFGLAFALACLIPTLYWMRHEMSYDSFYPNAEHIYRIYAMDKQSGKINESLSKIYEKKLREHFTAMISSTVFITQHENCRTEGILHVRLNMIYTESSFFNLFPQVFVCGDTSQPLQIINSIVLSETMAVRLFGDVEKAIGQQIQTTMRTSLPPYTVTAVVKDPPSNSNIQFDALIYHDMIRHFSEQPEEAQWKLFYMDLYVKLHPNTDVSKLSMELRDLTSRLNVNDNIELRMLPISNIRHGLNHNVPFTLNFIFLFVASGILLLFSALFNFLNLHLNIFRQRIQELYLRTANGASRWQLIRMMLFEQICAFFLALLLALGFVSLISPVFFGLINIVIEIPKFIHLFVVCGVGVMLLILSFSMIYVWRLSQLAMSLKLGDIITRQPVLHRIIVILQLTVSVMFIVAALVVMMQINFVNNKDLGFERDGIIQLSGFMDYSGKTQKASKRELATIPQVESITHAYFEPQHKVEPFSMATQVEWEGKTSHDKIIFNLIHTDSEFIETFRLRMLAGEWWREGETQNIVLNEEAVKMMSLDEPIGTIVRMPSFDNSSIIEEYRVVGVVNNFHTLSFRNHIQPTIFRSSPEIFNILYIRVAPEHEKDVIDQVIDILPNINVLLIDASLIPIGELYDRLNQSEQIGLKLFTVLAIVCLLISLFGIYAIAATSIQCRRKEIAIRKVMGAESNNIICMFFCEYALQVTITGAVALPFAYLIMSRWLQGYAYRTNIPLWLLAAVIVGVMLVVLLTVLGQVLKAANNNPAEVVKSE